MSYVTALFVNMVFSDEDKILTKIYHMKDTMRDSWGKNFRTKNGRRVALTGCSRSSETQAQWTDLRAAGDRESRGNMPKLEQGFSK